MELNSGYIVEKLFKFYGTKNLTYAINKIAQELEYSSRSIRRLLFENIYSKDLLFSVSIFLKLDPSKIFIK
jgi:hypothetical protein